MSALRRSKRKRLDKAYAIEEPILDRSDSDPILELLGSDHPSDDESDSSEELSKTRPSIQAKRRKLVPPSALDSLESLLPENHIFDSLFLSKIDTLTLASMWVDLYLDAANTEPLTSLLNTVLRACGSVYVFQAHDTAVIDAASASVAEITVLFSRQKSHKFPFKSVSTFRSNTVSFFHFIVQECLDRGILVSTEESPSLLQTILTWLSAFSACTIRPVRFCATTVIFRIASTLAAAVNAIDAGLSKALRQLSAASKRNTSRHTTLTSLISSYRAQRASIIDHSREILAIVLAHRYRDIDPSIRQECVKTMGILMAAFPEFWFQPQYLRYLGWLLSDQDNHVRLDVTKALLKLYRAAENANISLAFKLFTERFKLQIIKMCSIDSSWQVRYTCVGICCELVKLGFLDSMQINSVVAVFFQLILKQNSQGKASLLKIKGEVAKFISIVNVQQVNLIMDAHALFLKDNSCAQFGWTGHDLRIRDSVLVKHLTSLVHSAHQAAISENPDTYDDLDVCEAYSQLFALLVQLPTYATLWETLPQLLLLDPSGVEFTNSDGTKSDSAEVEELVSHLDVSLYSDRATVLGFLSGAATAILSEKLSTEDLIPEFLTRMVFYVAALSASAIKSNALLEAFLKLWVVLISSRNPAQNLYYKASEMDRVAVYNHVSIQLIQCFGSNQVDTPRLVAAFGPYLDCISADFAAGILGAVDLMTPEVAAEVNFFGAELVKNIADSSLLNTSNSEDLTELDMAKRLIEGCVEMYIFFAKLAEFGAYIDINVFFANDNTHVTSRILSRLGRNFSMDEVILGWANNFIEVAEAFESSLDAILLLEVALVSWTIEKLLNIEDPELQRDQDVLTLFSNTETLLTGLAALIALIHENFAPLSLNTSHWKNNMVEKLNSILTTLCCKFIDLVCALKVFYGKFKTRNEFLNFDSLFANGTFGADYVKHKIPEAIQGALLYLFLFKEARLAKLLSKDLEREDQEDVNLMGLIADIEIRETSEPFFRQSEFDSDSDDDDDVREERTRLQLEEQNEAHIATMSQRLKWKFEKDLCVYAVKLFALHELLMIDGTMMNRIELNAQALGGVYHQIVTQNQSKQKHAEPGRAPVFVPPPSETIDPQRESPVIDDEMSLDVAQPQEVPQDLLEEAVLGLIDD